MQWHNVQLYWVPFIHRVLLLLLFWGEGFVGQAPFIFAIFKRQSIEMLWMDDTSWKGRAWSLTKSLFSKTEKNSSGLYKVRINPLSWSYVIVHGASILFEKNVCVTIQLNCCPLKLQASCMSQIHTVRSMNVKRSFPELLRFLPLLILTNSRPMHLPSLMVRKPASFIQNTCFQIM